MTEDGCQEVAVLRCGWDLASVGPSLNLLRPGDATAVRVGGQGGLSSPAAERLVVAGVELGHGS
jgi:hypothetical protein